MPRTIPLHVNVHLPDDDPHTPEEVVSAVAGALEVGLDGEEWMGSLTADVTLAEEA